MALSQLSTLLDDARKQQRAVSALSVANLEMIQGVVHAAEETNTPVILQIAEVRLHTAPLHIIGPAMIAAAKASSVDIAVHLDHGLTEGCIEQAMEIGFTSVMYDGSHLPLVQNIENTQRLVQRAHALGVDVEAEVGRIGQTEDNRKSPIAYADPVEALRFLRETDVDALAVGIGNAHGVYEGAPDLHFDILRDISAASDVPLVLHGGTGIAADDFRHAIRLGVRKINIATALFQAAAEGAEGGGSIFDISQRMIDKTCAMAMHHMRIFGLAGKDCLGKASPLI